MSPTAMLMTVAEIDCRDGHKHLRYIRFPNDAGKDFCYRSRMSINSFAYHPKGRNYNPSKKNPKYLYHFEWHDYRHFAKGVPVVDVASIWEFYVLVGYNYKKKQWKQ